jgi:hypothetical protein
MVVKVGLGAANKCCFSLKKHLNSKLLSCRVECLMYVTLIRPVITHGSETWTVGKHGENLFRSFEWKLLQKIFSLVLENGLRMRCKTLKYISCVMNLKL